DREAIAGVVRASAMKHDLDQVRVGVRQMVGDDHDRAAAERRQMLSAMQRGFRKQNAVGENLVNSPRQWIAREVTPIRAGRGQGAAETNQRARSGRVELALQTIANLAECVPSGKER